MIPAGFEYARARSLRDALNALATSDGSKLLAGGHSLLPLMRFRLAQPGKLLDIGHLEELRGIAPKGRGVRIGAATTYREVLDSELVRERLPLLAEAVATIGDVQVRNRGTLGGALAHADPASDLPALTLALDGAFQLRSKRGRRSVPAKQFFLGPFTTALAADELVTEIVFPAMPRVAGWAYVKHEQKASGYALAGAAAVVARSRKTVTQCVVALTGVADHAFLAAGTDTLVGTKGDVAAIAAVAERALTGVEVLGDLHAPVEYRTHLARVAVRQALSRALERSR